MKRIARSKWFRPGSNMQAIVNKLGNQKLTLENITKTIERMQLDGNINILSANDIVYSANYLSCHVADTFTRMHFVPLADREYLNMELNRIAYRMFFPD